VVAGPGVHDHHDALRPKGKQLDCRDNTTEVESTVCITQLDGKATVTFKAPGVSGTHTINAECVNPVCAGPVSGDINVKVPGLAPIPVSPFSMQYRTRHQPQHVLLMKTSVGSWKTSGAFTTLPPINRNKAYSRLRAQRASLP
jgi:hypothetical protein